MAIVTDGLDAATLARWRARLDALLAEMERVHGHAYGLPERRDAWYALGNATVAVEEAIMFLDEAESALADDAREEGREAAPMSDTTPPLSHYHGCWAAPGSEGHLRAALARVLAGEARRSRPPRPDDDDLALGGAIAELVALRAERDRQRAALAAHAAPWQYPDPTSAAWRAEYAAAMTRRDWQTAAQMLDERAARECPAEATTATQGDGRAVEDAG